MYGYESIALYTSLYFTTSQFLLFLSFRKINMFLSCIRSLFKKNKFPSFVASIFLGLGFHWLSSKICNKSSFAQKLILREVWRKIEEKNLVSFPKNTWLIKMQFIQTQILINEFTFKIWSEHHEIYEGKFFKFKDFLSWSRINQGLWSTEKDLSFPQMLSVYVWSN